MNQITRLTQQKADAIAEKGYTVTGYVLTSPDGKKAIVDCQAVRWLDAADFQLMTRTATNNSREIKCKYD